MSDYSKLVKALRHCVSDEKGVTKCAGCPYYPDITGCIDRLHTDAAAAIEALEAEVKRLKECNDELREAQTYIDHYGDKWMTSAKDVPTSAYNHGYMDGKNEAEQALEPKRGEMVEVVRCKDCKHRPTGTGVNHDIEFPDARCPCQCYEDYWYSWMPSDDWYCGNGEKMEVQE